MHQTGERDYDAVRTAYARHEISAEVVPFLSNMPERFAWADVIVCRAGAMTAAELAAAGRSAIFIPFGRATDSHQLRNAQEMVKKGAGLVITEAELTGARLSQEIFSLVDNPGEIERMSEAAKSLARPNAASDIVDLIEQAAGIASRGSGTSNGGSLAGSGRVSATGSAPNSTNGSAASRTAVESGQEVTR